MKFVFASIAATAVELVFTLIALNKQQVASIVVAIGMIVARLSTLVALCDDVIGDPFACAVGGCSGGRADSRTGR